MPSAGSKDGPLYRFCPLPGVFQTLSWFLFERGYSPWAGRPLSSPMTGLDLPRDSFGSTHWVWLALTYCPETSSVLSSFSLPPSLASDRNFWVILVATFSELGPCLTQSLLFLLFIPQYYKMYDIKVFKILDIRQQKTVVPRDGKLRRVPSDKNPSSDH